MLFKCLCLTCGGTPELGPPPHDMGALQSIEPGRVWLLKSRQTADGGGGEGAVQVRGEGDGQGALQLPYGGALEHGPRCL